MLGSMKVILAPSFLSSFELDLFKKKNSRGLESNMQVTGLDTGTCGVWRVDSGLCVE